MRKRTRWMFGLGLPAGVVLGVLGLGFYLRDKIYLRWPHTIVPAADFDRVYTPEQLKADFLYLTGTVEHIHPDVMAIVDPSTYEGRKAAAAALINRPLKRLDFFRILAPFVGTTYNEGHTELLFPAEEWEAYREHGGSAPPVQVQVEPGTINITRSLADARIPAGSALVSINGVDAATLSRWLIDTQSMETLRGREAYAAARFAPSVWAYGITSPYKIVYRAPGAAEPASVDSPGITVAEWGRESLIGRNRPIDVTISDGIAHLTIKDFDQPWDQYEGWLKNAFQRIRDQQVQAVVLDLRDNQGGDTRQSDALQTYLSDSLLPAIAEVDVKTTPEVKAIYHTLLPEGFRWIPINTMIPELRGIQRAPDNGFYRSNPETIRPVKRRSPNPLAFHGDMYLLIGPYTYSTALIAAAPYHYWKRATVIGQPTEEGLTFYGDYYEFDLPNTKIQMHVSHKMFRLVGSTGRASQIVPDIATSPEHPDAYELALSVIAKKRG